MLPNWFLILLFSLMVVSCVVIAGHMGSQGKRLSAVEAEVRRLQDLMKKRRKARKPPLIGRLP